MKKSYLSLAILAFAALSAPTQAQTVLTVSSWLPPTHTASMAQKEWCDLLENNTKGRIKCNILPRGVSPAPGTYDAVKNGLADLSYTVHGYTPGRFVHTQMTELPFLGNSAESISVALSRVTGKHPEFAAEHQGVKVLSLFTHGPGIVFNVKRPIVKVEDLSGLKFRVGTLFPAESTESFKIDKIIQPATTFPGGMYNTSFVFMMNQGKYEKLSPEDKKAVDEISGETAARIFGRGWDKVDRRAFALMQVNNVLVTKADAKFVADVKSKTQSLEQNWITASKAKGLQDPAKVLAEFRAEIAKLEK